MVGIGRRAVGALAASAWLPAAAVLAITISSSAEHRRATSTPPLPPPHVESHEDGGVFCTADIRARPAGCEIDTHLSDGAYDGYSHIAVVDGTVFDACGQWFQCDCFGAKVDAGVLRTDGGSCLGFYPDAGLNTEDCPKWSGGRDELPAVLYPSERGPLKR